MNKLLTNVSTIVLVTISLLMGLAHYPTQALGASSPPVVGVWSDACQSFNITITNSACGSLTIGATISVQINMTNARIGSVNGYDFYLYYDPAYLNATGADKTSPLFINPSIIKSEFSLAGTVHLAGVCLACYNTSTSGALVNINFKILAIGVSPITLAAGLAPSGSAQSYTELTTPDPSSQFAVKPLVPGTADGYFKNEPTKLGPVASFTFSPSSPKPGKQVTFFANASYDLDASVGANNNGIILYKWDFGGVTSQSSSTGTSSYTIQLGAVYGNFSVRLTVVDNDTKTYFEGMKTRLFTVVQNPFHDLLVQSLTPAPNPANLGDKVTVSVIVFNNGTFPENFNLAVSYGSQATIIGKETNQSVAIGTSSVFSPTLDTSGLTAGTFYTITANVTIIPSLNNTKAVDNLPSNNVKSVVLGIRGGPSESSNLLLVVGGVLAGVVGLSAVGLLLRNRRRASASL